MRLDRLLQLRGLELAARDARQHNAIAPRKSQPAIEVGQPAILRQRIDHLMRIVPRLLDTLAGSLIAGLAVRRILPAWNSPRLPALAE